MGCKPPTKWKNSYTTSIYTRKDIDEIVQTATNTDSEEKSSFREFILKKYVLKEWKKK